MIHPAAIVHPGAKIGNGVEIGPYSVIGEHVEIGDDTWVGPHVVLEGHTRIGRENRIFQFSSLGGEPQDKKYSGEPTRLEIGDRNTIREYCSFSTGTAQDSGVTRIGDDNWIMAYVHIAHDCQIGNNTVFANGASLAGHAHIGDWAILGGFSGVHQFVRVGAHSFIGAFALLLQDLPPYVTVGGSPAAPHGINSEGLRRRGFSSEAINAIKQAYRMLYRKGLSLAEAREQIIALAAEYTEVKPLADFIGISGRGLVR
ncbi:MAG: acyl-ACP--UDP-N-acetylglucosamine O-acyltransferase [Proteobacteria bacterium]|jgi:UDP-N-acetylglucosamine acyltransferase|nr:acyl-ACP--UDP-N-acetylglucosamine O-acyltransferase [Pseudomonadota bacterium]